MAIPSELLKEELERFSRRIAGLRATPEERARILSTAVPFDYDTWLQEAGPADPENLAEMDELLRIRDEERQASLAAEDRALSQDG